MARSFLTPINLNKNELQNATVQNLGTAPSSPSAGQIYYDTTQNFTLVWNGSAWINSLARANHTGTQLAATISNLATTVQGYALNLFAAPTANIPMGGFTLTGLATPSAAGQAAEYAWVIGQVQSAAAGIASKPPAQAVATTNQATLSGLLTIDGYTMVANDRLLLTAQTTATQNGIYVVSSGGWVRASDDGSAPGEMVAGALWMVVNGTVNAGTQWRCSNTANPIVIGTTAITIVQFSAASSYSAGNGITFTGSVISVNPLSAGGIVVAAGGVSVDTTVVARKYSVSIGDGSTLAYVITHNLGTQDIVMMVKQSTTPFAEVECDMAATSTTTATFTFTVAPTTNQYRITVVG